MRLGGAIRSRDGGWLEEAVSNEQGDPGLKALDVRVTAPTPARSRRATPGRAVHTVASTSDLFHPGHAAQAPAAGFADMSGAGGGGGRAGLGPGCPQALL